MSDKNKMWSVSDRCVKSEINNVGEMIRSLRLSKGMTQRELALAIGSYAQKTFAVNISRYEKGKNLPSIKFIYMLSKVLEIEREIFFTMVLRERYERFTDMHHKMFFKAIRQKSVNNGLFYYFCEDGKVKHNFHKFSGIMKDAYYKKNISYQKISNGIVLQKGETHRYSVPNIYNVINGKVVPGLKIIIDLCEFFRLKTFETYKIMVEEKALGHAKNMMLQWNLYKGRKERIE